HATGPINNKPKGTHNKMEREKGHCRHQTGNRKY
ncbi:MAG: hypothetical protein ACI90V_012926, partial [Bacillariaceae sp.]